jgi:hypothetical protein
MVARERLECEWLLESLPQNTELPSAYSRRELCIFMLFSIQRYSDDG